MSDALIQAFHKLENTVNVAEEVFRIPSQRSQGRVQLVVDLSNLVLKDKVLRKAIFKPDLQRTNLLPISEDF